MKRFILLGLLAALLAAEPFEAQAGWFRTDLPDSPSVWCMATIGTTLFAGTDYGVYVTKDNGTNWTAVNTGLTTSWVNCLAVNGTNLFAATNGGGVFLSTNNGTSWTAVNTGLTNTMVLSLAVIGTNLFAGLNGGVFLSTNNGDSWTAVNTGLTNTNVTSIAVNGKNIYAGTYPAEIFLSTNNGNSWTSISKGLPNSAIRSFAFIGTNIFIGTNLGVLRTTDSGANWTTVNTGLKYTSIGSLIVSGTSLFAATQDFNYSGGVFLSKDNGTNWSFISPSFEHEIFSLFILGENLYAGTDWYVLRLPLTEVITGVKNVNSGKPEAFSLGQNYPNPFNPSTTIQYSIPAGSTGNHTLSVFDTRGALVRTLVESRSTRPGIYSVIWDGKDMAGKSASSGMYVYQFKAGAFSESRKLLLIR
jgi:photosystem II stability/assembly factor-like uncharacterized protein